MGVKKVLFIGNSHTYVHHVPARVARYGEAHGVRLDTVMLCKGGMGLDWHALEPQTAYNLFFGHYDAVVLQHVAHPFPGKEHLLDSVRAIRRFVPAETKAYLYMTWTEKNNPEGQSDMCAAYEEAAALFGASVCPVGHAWRYVRETRPGEELYFSDGEHSSVLGASLAAVVIGRTLLGEAADDYALCFEEAQKLTQWPDPAQLAWTGAGVAWQEG